MVGVCVFENMRKDPGDRLRSIMPHVKGWNTRIPLLRFIRGPASREVRTVWLGGEHWGSFCPEGPS